MNRPFIEQFISCQDSTPESLIEGTMRIVEYERAKGKLSPSNQPARLSPDGKFLYLAPFWVCRDNGSSFLEGADPESRNCLPVRIYHESLFNLLNPLEVARHHVPATREAASHITRPKEPGTLFGLVNLYHNTIHRLEDTTLHSKNPEQYRSLNRKRGQVGDTLISRLLNRRYQR